MKEIAMRDYPTHAGKWIYSGYTSAWASLGYKITKWTNLTPNLMRGKALMMTDSDIIAGPNWESEKWIESFMGHLNLCEKVYMFVSPNTFPDPYGSHENFVSKAAKHDLLVEALNKHEKVIKWTFCDAEEQYWGKWDNVHTVPLAFDSLNYKPIYDKKWEYDVVYCGSWANNGFDTKKGIMKEHFLAFKEAGLKCGFFINRDLTHEQECKMLTNAKVCINIHDQYQRELNLDTNERTFKALGLNGSLVSDYNGQIQRLFDGVFHGVMFSKDADDMVSKVKEYINMKGLAEYKKENIEFILKNHTYIHRCKHLEGL